MGNPGAFFGFFERAARCTGVDDEDALAIQAPFRPIELASRAVKISLSGNERDQLLFWIEPG